MTKKCYIVVKDEENGFLASDLEANTRHLKKRNFGEEAEKTFISKGEFLLGTDSICRGLHYEAILGGLPMYRFLLGANGFQSNELAKQRKYVLDFARMLLHYENSKKEFMRQMKMTLAEMYILFYFSDGVEKKGSDIYLNIKFDVFGAGKSRVLSGLKRLVRDGYLEKRGKTNIAVYKISTLGMDMFYTCLSKYILNF